MDELTSPGRTPSVCVFVSGCDRDLGTHWATCARLYPLFWGSWDSLLAVQSVSSYCQQDWSGSLLWDCESLRLCFFGFKVHFLPAWHKLFLGSGLYFSLRTVWDLGFIIAFLHCKLEPICWIRMVVWCVRDVTFICGRAGVCALGAVAAKHNGDERLMNYYLTQFNEVGLHFIYCSGCVYFSSFDFRLLVFDQWNGFWAMKTDKTATKSPWWVIVWESWVLMGVFVLKQTYRPGNSSSYLHCKILLCFGVFYFYFLNGKIG